MKNFPEDGILRLACPSNPRLAASLYELGIAIPAEFLKPSTIRSPWTGGTVTLRTEEEQVLHLSMVEGRKRLRRVSVISPFTGNRVEVLREF